MTQGTEGLDPRLEDWFERLRPTPPRDPQRAAQGREGFLQQARSLGRPVSPGPDRRLIGWRGLLRPLARQENWPMTKVAALLMSIVLFLGGGAGLTAYAAQDALPGDALYGIKTGLEQTQLALSSTAAGDFELHIQFAAERLNEITALLADDRYEDGEAAVDALAYELEQASEALQVVAEEDPILASELAGRFGNFMTESRQVIAALVLSAPQGAQGVLGDALSVVEAGSGELDGGDIDQPDEGQVDEPADGDIDHQPDEGQADEPDGGNVDQPDEDQADEPDAGNIDQADNVEPNETDQPDVDFE